MEKGELRITNSGSFVVHIPNTLTVLRMAVVAPLVVWAIARGSVWLALGFFAAGALTDLLDGLTARWLNVCSDWGKFLDPLADKVFTHATFAAMLWHGIVPASFGWVYILLLFFELLLFRASVRPGSSGATYFGKTKTCALWCLLALFFFQWAGFAVSSFLLQALFLFGLYMAFLSLMSRRPWTHAI